MGSNNINRVLSHYLQEILELYQADDSPGINGYCSILKSLLNSSLDFLPGDFSKENVEIELNQKLLRGVQGGPNRSPLPGAFLEKSPPGKNEEMTLWTDKH